MHALAIFECCRDAPSAVNYLVYIQEKRFEKTLNYESFCFFKFLHMTTTPISMDIKGKSLTYDQWLLIFDCFDVQPLASYCRLS